MIKLFKTFIEEKSRLSKQLVADFFDDWGQNEVEVERYPLLKSKKRTFRTYKRNSTIQLLCY